VATTKGTREEGDDEALLALLHATAARDDGEAARLLDAATALARVPLHTGASRTDANEHFLVATGQGRSKVRTLPGVRAVERHRHEDRYAAALARRPSAVAFAVDRRADGLRSAERALTRRVCAMTHSACVVARCRMVRFVAQ
jgi:hypothetical protein